MSSSQTYDYVDADSAPVPWVVWGFFKLITPFIDPLTRQKLKFNEDMRQYVPEQELWTEFGGKLDFEYDHATYWPALRKLCEEKRAFRKERWVAGGSHIGEHEDYLAGGKETGVAASSGQGDQTQGKGEEATPALAPASESVPAESASKGEAKDAALTATTEADAAGTVDQSKEKETDVASAPAPGASGADDVTDALAKVELEGRPEGNFEADAVKPENGTAKVEGV